MARHHVHASPSGEQTEPVTNTDPRTPRSSLGAAGRVGSRWQRFTYDFVALSRHIAERTPHLELTPDAPDASLPNATQGRRGTCRGRRSSPLSPRA